MYENIRIVKYDGEYHLILKLDNLPFPTEKSVIISDTTNASIKRGLMSLVRDLDFKKIEIKEY